MEGNKTSASISCFN